MRKKEARTWDDWCDDLHRVVEMNGAENVAPHLDGASLLVLLRNVKKLREERDAWMRVAEELGYEMGVWGERK